jgi:hypothetical protein
MDGIYKCCPKLKIGKKRGHLSGTYFIDNMWFNSIGTSSVSQA